MIEAPQLQGDQPTPYTPAGPPDPLIFEDFEGINTATLRPGVDDKQAAWLDGFMPLGPRRNLRTMYGVSTALYTAPGALTVAFFDFGNIGVTPYSILVQSDGSIVAINTVTSVANTIAAAGTIQNPSRVNVGFTQLKQTNGFLYLVADSSVNYMSGVQTSGATPITTFTNQNADPEAGTSWPATVDVFNRNILFANAFGAQVSYGGAVTKISEMLDGVYNTVANFGNIVPSAAKAIVFGKKIWILLLPIIDPVKGQQVNKLWMWNGKQWWASVQDVNLVYIQFQEINSVLTAWGTDGKSVYQLFARPSVNFTKTAQTKLWDKPGGYQFTKFVTRLWGIVRYYSALASTLNITLDNELGSSPALVVPVSSLAAIWTMAGGGISTWTTASATISTWLLGGGTGYSVFQPDAVGQQGVLTGFTLTTNAADMAVVSMMIQDTIAGNRG